MLLKKIYSQCDVCCIKRMEMGQFFHVFLTVHTHTLDTFGNHFFLLIKLMMLSYYVRTYVYDVSHEAENPD